jgi:hypothetical protein
VLVLHPNEATATMANQAARSCPVCNAVVPDGSEFCAQCGTAAVPVLARVGSDEAVTQPDGETACVAGTGPDVSAPLPGLDAPTPWGKPLHPAMWASPSSAAVFTSADGSHWKATYTCVNGGKITKPARPGQVAGF